MNNEENEKPSVMTKAMRQFEATMQLKDLKVGDVLTAQHMGALDFFLGKLFEAARQLPMTKMTFEPNAEGTNLVQTKSETETPEEVKARNDAEAAARAAAYAKGERP